MRIFQGKATGYGAVKLTDRQFYVLYAYAADVLRVEWRWGSKLHHETRDLQARVSGDAGGGAYRCDWDTASRIIGSADATAMENDAAIFMVALCIYAIKQGACDKDKPEAVSDDHDALLTAILSAGAALATALNDPTRTALQNELSKITTDDGQSKAGDTSAVETTKNRRARWLEWYGDGERGALQRVYERELSLNPKADRSYIGKQIKTAKDECAAKKRSVAWAAQLVQHGKR